MSQIKPILGLAVVVIVFYVAWNMIPPYFHNYEFQDYVENEARDSTYTNQTADDVKALVLKEARKDEIPINAEQINIVKNPNDVISHYKTVDIFGDPTKKTIAEIMRDLHIPHKP